jgi:hypothetical protein
MNRAGERCARQPIPGGEVCVMHGGRAPQVQASAKARLLAGADLAIDYLLNLLTPKPPCEKCGRSDADRDPVVVRACQLVLDRSGYHPTVNVVQAPTHDEFEGLSVFEIVDRAEQIARAARAMADEETARVARLALPEAMDGVLLDNGFEVPEDEGPIPEGEHDHAKEDE